MFFLIFIYFKSFSLSPSSLFLTPSPSNCSDSSSKTTPLRPYPHKNSNNVFECKGCMLFFSDEDLFFKHTSTCTYYKMWYQILDFLEQTYADDLFCKTHKYTYSSKTNLKKHIFTHHSTLGYTCLNCNLFVKQRVRLKSHRCSRPDKDIITVKNSFGIVRNFHDSYCKQCNFSIFQPVDFKDHVCRVTQLLSSSSHRYSNLCHFLPPLPLKPLSLPPPSDQSNDTYSCPTCSETFKKGRSFFIHKTACNKSPAFHIELQKLLKTSSQDLTCLICKTSFANLTSLKIHMTTQHSSFKYLCPHCRLTFSYKDQLLKHSCSKNKDSTPLPSKHHNLVQTQFCYICHENIAQIDFQEHNCFLFPYLYEETSRPPSSPLPLPSLPDSFHNLYPPFFPPSPSTHTPTTPLPSHLKGEHPTTETEPPPSILSEIAFSDPCLTHQIEEPTLKKVKYFHDTLKESSLPTGSLPLPPIIIELPSPTPSEMTSIESCLTHQIEEPTSDTYSYDSLKDSLPLNKMLTVDELSKEENSMETLSDENYAHLMNLICQSIQETDTKKTSCSKQHDTFLVPSSPLNHSLLLTRGSILNYSDPICCA